MITAEQDKELTEMFWILKDVPGWLSDLKESGYTQKELDYFENLSDVNLPVDRKMDEWNKEVNNSNGTEIFFEVDIDKKIALLSKMIDEAWGRIKSIRESGGNYIEKEMAHRIFKIEPMEKLRKRLRAGQCHQPDQKGSNGSRVTDAEIVRAREYPIEKLIEVGPGGKVLCPWHQDTKPSGYVKNGFFYCFTCNEWSDSIKWLMKVHNYSFTDAVKKLS